MVRRSISRRWGRRWAIRIRRPSTGSTAKGCEVYGVECRFNGWGWNEGHLLLNSSPPPVVARPAPAASLVPWRSTVL